MNDKTRWLLRRQDIKNKTNSTLRDVHVLDVDNFIAEDVYANHDVRPGDMLGRCDSSFGVVIGVSTTRVTGLDGALVIAVSALKDSIVVYHHVHGLLRIAFCYLGYFCFVSVENVDDI